MRVKSAAAIVLACAAASSLLAQTRGFTASFDDPAIRYFDAPTSDAVSALARDVAAGAVHLSDDPRSGYLDTVLAALHVPIDSQVAVFSQTSFQSDRISRSNPRAILFNDTVAVGWVRGGDLEFASQDPRQGVVFYTLTKTAAGPKFERPRRCLECHVSWETFGVPGEMVLTTGPPDPAGYATGGVVDDRTPLSERWGGWFVTGSPGVARHMGNAPVDLPLAKRPARTPVLRSLDGQFDLAGFPAHTSDVVALMVLEHQTRMTSLLTYAGWQARVGAAAGDVRAIARDVVDYMLFVDEAPLAGRVEGSSGFAERFSAEGPRDAGGRSLRQLDLGRRLFRYPCSYLIYAPVFEALPAAAKDAIYERLWQVLSGQEQEAKYRRLTAGDRTAILEILRATKRDLPAVFNPTRGSGV